jgi:hypothetical protein
VSVACFRAESSGLPRLVSAATPRLARFIKYLSASESLYLSVYFSACRTSLLLTPVAYVSVFACGLACTAAACATTDGTRFSEVICVLVRRPRRDVCQVGLSIDVCGLRCGRSAPCFDEHFICPVTDCSRRHGVRRKDEWMSTQVVGRATGVGLAPGLCCTDPLTQHGQLSMQVSYGKPL